MGSGKVSKSIIQTNKACWVCGYTMELERHHIFYGSANRKLSEKWGCWCWLCHEHHTGNTGIHFNPDLDDILKKYAQERFEALCGTREDFRRIFGKSYLNMI